MPDDDVVDILGYLSVDLRKQYLSMMKNTSQENLKAIFGSRSSRQLVRSDDDEFITLSNLTVSATLQ